MSDHDVSRMDDFMDWTRDYPAEYCPHCKCVQPIASYRVCGEKSVYCGVCNKWIETMYRDDDGGYSV